MALITLTSEHATQIYKHGNETSSHALPSSFPDSHKVFRLERKTSFFEAVVK